MANYVNTLSLDVSNYLKGIKTALNITDKISKGIDAKADIDVAVHDAQLDALQAEVKALDGKNVNLDIKVDDSQLDKATAKAAKAGAATGGLLGGAIGATLGGAAVNAAQAGFSAFIDAGKEADRIGDLMELSFSTAGLSGANLANEIQRAEGFAEGLGEKFAISPTRIKELQSSVAALSGSTGKQNEDLTKLALGVETATNGLVSGEAAVKAFSKGIADPEGAAAIDALSKKFPALAESLRTPGDPAAKLQKSLSALGPTFATMEKQAGDGGGQLEVIKGKLEGVLQSIAGPALDTALVAISAVVNNFQALAPYLGLAAAAVVGYTIAQNAAGIATSITAAKTVILNAVMNANPIGVVIVAVLAAVAAFTLLADAMEVTAEEQLAAAEATVKVTESQIEDNKAKQEGARSTQAMVKEYKELASKSKLTAAEQEKLRGITQKLDQQYPSLIDQTKTFGENLKGVDEIGKAATTSMEGFSAEAERLGKQLEQQTKMIAFAKRNVAVGELNDQFGFFDFNTSGVDRQKFIIEYRKERQKFVDALFKAQNVQDAQNAQSAFNEFINNSKYLQDNSEEQIKVIGLVSSVMQAQIAATDEAYGKTKKLNAEVVKTPKPTTTEKTDTKDAKSALELAQAELQALTAKRSADAITNKNANDRLVALKKLTPAEAERLELLQKQTDAALNLADANKLLGFSSVAGVTTTTLQLDKDESLSTIETQIQQLSQQVEQSDVAVIRYDVKLRDEAEAAFDKEWEELEKAIAKQAIDTTEPVKEEISAFTEAVAGALSGFKIEIDTGQSDEALERTKELIEDVNKEFDAGQLTYEGALDKLKDVGEEQVGFFESFANAIVQSGKALSDTLQKAAIDGSNAGKNIAETVGVMGVAVGASFLAMAAGGEDVWVAIAKSAFNGLQALVPIFSAQILAGSLATPQSIATAGGAGLTQWAVMTALIQTAVSGARALLGFKGGGYTGSGAPDGVAGVVHYREWVADEQMTNQYRNLFEHLDANKPLEEYPEIQKMLANAGITSLDARPKSIDHIQPIAFVAPQAANTSATNARLDAILDQLQGMQAVQKQVRELEIIGDGEGFIKEVQLLELKKLR